MQTITKTIADGFTATFTVDRIPRHVWEAAYQADADGTCRVPGFPDIGSTTGAHAVVLDTDPERLLRCRKTAFPCQDSEITIQLAPANASGLSTLVSASQTGLGPMLEAMPGVMAAHWCQIAADLRLYLEREVFCPPTQWGSDIGVIPRETPIGLMVDRITPGSLADGLGLVADDLLLCINGIRLHSIAQLWTTMALTTNGAAVTIDWIRGKTVHTGSAKL